MGYSKVIIEFTSIPNINNILNIDDETRGIVLTETFKTSRTGSRMVKIPEFEYEAATDTSRYIGYISDYYKLAFDLDYNATGLYTVKSIRGAVDSGLGTVIITSNTEDRIFDNPFSTVAGVIITIENGSDVPEPVSVTPNSLSFTAKTNAVNVPVQPIIIIADSTWMITSEVPEWLEITGLSGSGNGSSILKVINYNMMEPGIYNYNLVYEISGLEFTVAVSLEVIEVINIISPYQQGKPAFTLDQKNFIIQSERTDTYFQLDSIISVYKFFSNELETHTIPQKVLLFKGKSEINIGKLIHRLMDKFITINENQNQYKLANLDIVCNEFGLDDTPYSINNLSNIKFVAGLSNNFSDYGFLEYNGKPTRVTVDAYYFLNILIPSGNYELRIFKNGIQIGNKLLPTNSAGPICEKVTFNNYIQGDTIEFKIAEVDSTDENLPSKKFYIFPSQFFSNVIVWENEFLLQSAFEFTNDQDIKLEIDRQSSKTFNRFVERTTHHSVLKENKLTINTGWITTSDVDSIESLLMSKRAFIKLDGKIVELVPNTKTLTPFDSKEELKDYTLEFTINRIYHEETYTF